VPILAFRGERENVFSIGEFSKITGLTVKTLRFYHEEGVLTPSYIDDETGYRYYAAGKVETARVIAALRRLEFSVREIAEILKSCDDEADLLDELQRRQEAIEAKLRQYRQIHRSLGQIITSEREARAAMQRASLEVEEKTVDSMLIAGVRMKGRYSDCGKGFARIGRRFGRQICGKPFLLHYDTEYKEDDADFEACRPVRKGASADGIAVRELPGGRCLSLLHRGPYEEIGRAYATILQHAKDKGFEIDMPTREVYIKGPGMIFRGNPKKYLTEIQMLIKKAQQ
jgi:DNA-binding transcriptional MerR regulator/effector-binding domain-containing protein